MFRCLLLAGAALSMAAPASAATPANIVGNLIPDAATGPIRQPVIQVEIGQLAIGYSADLVAVNENPLMNIHPLEKAE